MHIEGTLEPQLICELAESNTIALPWVTLDERRAVRVRRPAVLLNLYYANLDVLRQRE